MTRIYLISSAEAESDLYRIAQGWGDSCLTDRGWRQTRALEQRFMDIQLDAVYASDLFSASATASALCRMKNLVVSKREDLRELCFGDWECMSWGTIAHEAPRQLRNLKNAPDQWYVDDAELPAKVQKRMLCAVREIADAHQGGAVAVVSHNCAIQLLLAELAGLPLAEVRMLEGTHTAVSVIEAENGALRLVSRANVDHLQDPAYQAAETSRTTPDFDADMSFYLLRWIEYSDMMAEAVECIWPETGDARPFNKDTLLNDAAMLVTTVGYVEQTPAGFLQMGAEPGWITLLCTHPGCREAGLGTQLLGQAVLSARDKNADYLHIALSKSNQHRKFFINQGFQPVGELPDGRDVFEKDIRFPTDIL